MILVTGAAGKTGGAVCRALEGGNEPVRALVFRAEQAQSASQNGASEVVIGDMRDTEVLVKALQGVRAVYHIPPNMNPDEEEIGRLLIDTASSLGVEKFVYHSVFRPSIEPMPHHWAKMKVEAMLFSAPLVFSILQPTAYMQNITGGLNSILERGEYLVPYAPETSTSLVDLEDLAEVASKAIKDPTYDYGTFEIVGVNALNQIEICETLSDVLGKKIQLRQQTFAEWADSAKISGMEGTRIENFLKMFEYYETYNFNGNTKVLEHLLGRPPGTLTEVIRRELTNLKVQI